MKCWAINVVILAIALASGAARADEGKFPTFETEYYFRKAYITKPDHKAMAVGLNGSFGASWNYENDKQAARNAIATCRKDFARLKDRDGNDSKCRLVVVGDRPVADDVVSLSNWQAPAPGADKPLSVGYRSLLPNKTARGILLAIHGCDGEGSLDYSAAWGRFYNSLGFDYYAPDSFADPRPPSVCGNQSDRNGAYRVSEVFRLRIAQTHRTINKLRVANPGLPIYLWGHSQGSIIVQAIEANVEGIIASGNACGIFNLPVAAASSVPFLYVMGANDKFVDGVKRPITEKSLQTCQKFMGKRKWKAAVIQNNGHAIWPWREAAAKAIAEFVGGSWRKVAQAELTGKPTPTISFKYDFEMYKKGKNHRAFVVSPKSVYSWSDNWEYAEDAVQFALFNCAKTHTIDIFATGRHHCVLVDVDGKAQR